MDNINETVNKIQPIDTSAEVTPAKKPKKPIKIPKSAKALMFATIALITAFAAAAAIIIPRVAEKRASRAEYEKLIDVDLDYDTILAGVDNSILDLYRDMFVGKFIARTSNLDTKGKITFQFDDNGVFYGHTSRYEDDCGTWELTNEGGTIAMITKVPDLMERYEVGLNNNNDITLKAVDGTIMVLEPADRVFETAKEDVQKQ